MFSYFALHNCQVLLCMLVFPHLKSSTYDPSFQHRSALPGSADGKSERHEAGVIEVEMNSSCRPPLTGAKRCCLPRKEVKTLCIRIKCPSRVPFDL